MTEKPRTRTAKIRALHGRAERLRREAGEAASARAAKGDTPRRQRTEASTSRKAGVERTGNTGKEAVGPHREPAERRAEPGTHTAQPRLDPARPLDRSRQPTPLHLVQERLERSRATADRRQLQRLERETRNSFNQAGERRRDAARRVEFDRKLEALQTKEKRIAEYQHRANIRRLERKRGELKRQLNLAADRRRNLARRAELDRHKDLEVARQKELQQRAAIEIEKEQKRRSADQQAAHRRETDAMRARHKVERDSFRTNEDAAMERHHHAIKGIDAREERELADFDGRRKGLAGRAAELIPGRKAENDQKRAEMVRGYESERLHKHREFEAYKERAFRNEMKAHLDRAHERKALMELHRTDRDSSNREQVDTRPRQIEARARVIERVDRAQEQERERAQAEQRRENVRPSEDFGRAASGWAREPASDRPTLHQDVGREIPAARTFERA